MTKEKRVFESGAMRDTDQDKLDYEAFLCPLVTQRYAQFMHKHRKMPDGTYRDGDNWQKGIPLDQLIKSATRHMEDVKLHHRGYSHKTVEDLQESICGVVFNMFGYLKEELDAEEFMEPMEDSAEEGLVPDPLPDSCQYDAAPSQRENVYDSVKDKMMPRSGFRAVDGTLTSPLEEIKIDPVPASPTVGPMKTEDQNVRGEASSMNEVAQFSVSKKMDSDKVLISFQEEWEVKNDVREVHALTMEQAFAFHSDLSALLAAYESR